MNRITQPTKCSLVYKPTTFSYHTFNASMADRTIVFQVIKMKDSVFVFINYKDSLHLVDLSMAMLNRHDKMPMGTQILGDFSESTSKNMAMRLSKRLQKPVYISCNTDNERLVTPAIEKRIQQEISTHPDKF